MMIRSLVRPRLSLAVVALGATSFAFAACGSSSPSAQATAGASGNAGAVGTAGTTGTNTGTAGSGLDAAAPEGCPKSALTVLFNPMFSAYDGVHTFQIPAVVNGIDPSAIQIDWSASDPTMVALEPDATTGGVMITTQKAGTVSIIASAGSLCGASLLTITASTADDWTAGSQRYNTGVDITRIMPTRPMMGGNRDAGTDTSTDGGLEAACTSCHGDTAAGAFKTVQHTPEQTGGFSDADLIDIFEHGIVPKGGYFDTSIVPYAFWQSFHRWSVGGSEKGLVVYLRSLTPAAQTGAANFGGRLDGGVRGGRDGGGPEGGMGMRRDAGAGN
jgi:hypothetical protein